MKIQYSMVILSRYMNIYREFRVTSFYRLTFSYLLVPDDNFAERDETTPLPPELDVGGAGSGSFTCRVD